MPRMKPSRPPPSDDLPEPIDIPAGPARDRLRKEIERGMNFKPSDLEESPAAGRLRFRAWNNRHKTLAWEMLTRKHEGMSILGLQNSAGAIACARCAQGGEFDAQEAWPLTEPRVKIAGAWCDFCSVSLLGDGKPKPKTAGESPRPAAGSAPALTPPKEWTIDVEIELPAPGVARAPLPSPPPSSARPSANIWDGLDALDERMRASGFDRYELQRTSAGFLALLFDAAGGRFEGRGSSASAAFSMALFASLEGLR